MRLTVQKAQSQLPQLIDAACNGVEVVIAEKDVPLVMIVPLPRGAVSDEAPPDTANVFPQTGVTSSGPEKTKRKWQRKKMIFGTLKGKLDIPDDFFDHPMTEEDLKLWEGG